MFGGILRAALQVLITCGCISRPRARLRACERTVCARQACGSPGLSHNLIGSFPVIKFQLGPPAVGWNQPVTRVDASGGPVLQTAGLDRNAGGAESLPRGDIMRTHHPTLSAID